MLGINNVFDNRSWFTLFVYLYISHTYLQKHSASTATSMQDM